MSKNKSDTDTKKTKVKCGYAPVNGLRLYYETHGTGQPLVLVHGGLGTVDMFAQLVPALARTRQVIAVELQAHGHTPDVDRPLSFESMADDVAALIQHQGFDHADLLGYSLGGGVALQTAVRHPDRVRKLVVVSAPHKSQGWYPEVLAGQRSINAEAARTWVGSPMHQAYASVAPRPEDWEKLVVKTSDLLRHDYDWSPAVSALKMPILIVLGDADAIRPARAAEFFELLGGGLRDAGWDGSGMSTSRLAVLPATTHYNICSSPLLPAAVTSFLDAPMPNDK
jgi:pimeloyl-ACP methyl ester carboxylesterase